MSDSLSDHDVVQGFLSREAALIRGLMSEAEWALFEPFVVLRGPIERTSQHAMTKLPIASWPSHNLLQSKSGYALSTGPGKIHAFVDTNGLPVRLALTAGEVHGIGVRDPANLATNTGDLFREMLVYIYRVALSARPRDRRLTGGASFAAAAKAAKIERAASKQARISKLLTDLREPPRTAFELG
jgi:hypothetical protein